MITKKREKTPNGAGLSYETRGHTSEPQSRTCQIFLHHGTFVCAWTWQFALLSLILNILKVLIGGSLGINDQKKKRKEKTDGAQHVWTTVWNVWNIILPNGTFFLCSTWQYPSPSLIFTWFECECWTLVGTKSFIHINKKAKKSQPGSRYNGTRGHTSETRFRVTYYFTTVLILLEPDRDWVGLMIQLWHMGKIKIDTG